MLLHEFFRSIKPRSIVQQDMLIAAHARFEDMILVTNNVREFERVPDLVVENWIEQLLYVCGRAQPQSRIFSSKMYIYLSCCVPTQYARKGKRSKETGGHSKWSPVFYEIWKISSLISVKHSLHFLLHKIQRHARLDPFGRCLFVDGSIEIRRHFLQNDLLDGLGRIIRFLCMID